MDALIARAVEDYDRLLKDEKELIEEMDDRLFERMRQAKLTFGGRVLCPFLRPNFVSPEVYDQVRAVGRGIIGAIEKAEARLGTELWDRVDLTPEERELMAIEPGYRRSSPTSRLDAFLTPSAYQFVELNAEALPRPGAAARDAPRVLSRGRGPGRASHDRHRRLRRRADAHRAPPLP